MALPPVKEEHLPPSAPAQGSPLHLPLFGLAILLLLGLRFWLPFSHNINSGLAILVTIGLLWLTEAIPLTITALLVPILAVLLGVFPLKQALSEFANPILYLFLGGFTLAAALAHQGLDSLLAQRILRLARGRLELGALLLFLISAGLSMWISNTATTAMMMPLALGLTHKLDPEQDRPTLVFLLLGVAYSASIGGIGTLVGSPPNAIAAAQLGMSFTDWLWFGLPVVLLLWPVAMLLLWWGLKPRLKVRFELESQPLIWTRGRRLTLLIFSLTVLGWIFSAFLAEWLGGIAQFDALVALLAVVAVAVSGVARWQDINQATDWGVLLLFGGGLTLSAVLSHTGTSAFLAEQIALALRGAHPFSILLLLAGFVVFLTELTSNTATAALLIPLFISVAAPLQVAPVVMAVLIAVGASCAFMLPVATPPNAIVYASGLIRQREMMRTGLRLNLVLSLLLACLAYFVGDVLA